MGREYASVYTMAPGKSSRCQAGCPPHALGFPGRWGSCTLGQQDRRQSEENRMAHRAVSIGLLLPTREVVMAPGAPDLSKIIDLAVRAEELGFDSVWVGDSILARPRLEAMTTLAAVAS